MTLPRRKDEMLRQPDIRIWVNKPEKRLIEALADYCDDKVSPYVRDMLIGAALSIPEVVRRVEESGIEIPRKYKTKISI